MNAAALRLVAVWTLKVGLGAVLLVAGWAKVGDPAAFAEEIANYRLWPEVAPYLAPSLPTLELVLGLVLIGVTPRSPWLQAAASTGGTLMAAFTVALVWVVLSGIDVECGCFGTGGGAITWLTVARDVGLVLGFGALVVLARWPGRAAPALA